MRGEIEEPEPAPVAPTGLLSPGPLRQATVGVILLTTLFAFENLAVSTAMPSAVADLHGLAWYGWGYSAFIIPQLLGNVLGGVLSDRRGAALPVFAGVGAFILGLLVAGSATTMGQFILGRGVQGVGAGLVMVAIYVVIAEVYPETLRPRAIAALSAAWVVPTLIGPGAAGLLTQFLSWRAVFLVIVPLAVIGLVLVLPVVRGLTRSSPREAGAAPRADRWRWPSALAVAAGIALLQLAGQRLNLLSILPLVAGLALVVLGLPRLLPRGVFRLRRGLPTLMLLRATMSGAYFGIESAVTLTLAKIHGLPPTAVGLPLIVGSLGWSAAAWIAGRQPEERRRRGMRLGFCLIVVAGLAMAALGWPQTPGWIAFPAWVIGGAGIGMAMPAVSVLVLNLSAPAERGANTSSLQIADGTGTAICIALQGTLVAAATAGALSLGHAVTTLDLVLAALALCGALLTSRVLVHPTLE